MNLRVDDHDQLPVPKSHRRDKILNEVNRSTLDDVEPLGDDQGMTVLKEMNELETGHNEFVKTLAPILSVS